MIMITSENYIEIYTDEYYLCNGRRVKVPERFRESSMNTPTSLFNV